MIYLELRTIMKFKCVEKRLKENVKICSKRRFDCKYGRCSLLLLRRFCVISAITDTGFQFFFWTTKKRISLLQTKQEKLRHEAEVEKNKFEVDKELVLEKLKHEA